MKAFLIATVLTLLETSSQDTFLSRFEGRWTGSGTVLGQPSRIEIDWKWTLGGHFLHLTFRNEMGVAPATKIFEGQAFYRASGDSRYRGMWFDNAGMMRPIEAARQGETLVSRWGTTDTEEGETTYLVTDAGRLEVTDRVKGKDGTWRTFGQSGLMKR